MTLIPVPRIDVDAIKRLVGGGAFERGRAYQRSGHVADWHWDLHALTTTGVVSGTASVPYECTIRYGVSSLGGFTVRDTECSCPVGSSCKHVVAVLLDTLESDDGPGDPAPGRMPAWRGWMQHMTSTPAPPPREGSGGEEPELALGVQVKARADGTVLRAKPVRRTRKGAWSKSGDVTWDSVRFAYGHGWYGGSRTTVGARVAAWFADLGNLGGSRYGAGAWRDLGDFGRLLWPLLAEADEVGVPVVGVEPADEVRVVSSSAMTLDLVRAPGGSGLRVVPSVTFDGSPPDAEALTGSVGEHGLFAVTTRGRARSIVLGPTTEPLSEAQISALVMPQLEVPEPDVTEFLTTYYPRLRGRLTVRAGDGVELPESTTPALVCTAVFEGSTRATVTWSWQYGDGVAARRYTIPDRDGMELRDVEAEARIAADAARNVRRSEHFAGFRLVGRHEVSGLAVLELATEVLPALDELDEVRVETHEKPDYTELAGAPEVAVSAAESGDVDWFDLGVSVRVDGRDVPLPVLLGALTRGEDRVVLPDGAWLRTDHPSLNRLRELVAEAVRLSDRPGKLRLSRYNASLWGDLAEVADVVEQSEAWRRSAGQLLGLVAAGSDRTPVRTVELPAGLKAELRPYQRHGYEWLCFLARHGLGGILADDMGLGKTVQTLAFLARAREGLGEAGPRKPGDQPYLVVAPASVVSNWVTEARRFTPDLRVVSLTATPGRLGRTVEEVADDADVVVTSYAIFRLAHEGFRDVGWGGLILDEAQFAKNHATRANETARLLRVPFKLAITGTPMENNLMELWAILAIVAPGLYGSAGRFREDYVRVVEAGAKDPELAEHADRVVARLRRRIRPIMLRRTKEQVAPELPRRQEQVLGVDLHAKHRVVYDRHLQRERSRMLGLLEDFDSNRIAIFRSLTTLRRLALDASLVDPDLYDGVPSAKLDVLAEQLTEVAAEGHRALVFSQFTSFLRMAADRLAGVGLAAEYLDGSTTGRADVIRRFKQGSAPVFLISLKAGGFGLNLTEADYVYLLDPWWNPATEAQAVDRTHRIGQTRNVMVFRMVSSGTIEEKVMALKERKARLFGAVMNDDDGTFSGGLTSEDIRSLLDDA